MKFKALYDRIEVKEKPEGRVPGFHVTSLIYRMPQGRSMFNSSGPPLAEIKVPLTGPLYTPEDWIPLELIKGDSFCGVDRSIDRARLAGTRFEASGDLTQALAFINREGGRPGLCLTGNALYPESLNTVFTKYGKIDVIRDPSVPGLWMFQLDTWHLVKRPDGEMQLVCTAPGWNLRSSK